MEIINEAGKTPGQILIEYQERMGLSVSALAGMIGVTVGALSYYRKNRRRPEKRRALLLLNELRLDGKDRRFLVSAWGHLDTLDETDLSPRSDVELLQELEFIALMAQCLSVRAGNIAREVRRRLLTEPNPPSAEF